METIGEQKIWTFLGGSEKAQVSSCTAIRKGMAHRVKNYMDLARKVAELQFMNRDFMLLYRGQGDDFLNDQRNSSLKPSIFREANSNNPNQTTLVSRFDALIRAEKHLTAIFNNQSFLGRERLRRQRILRWSILQHYEVCQTPLLDVSQSLRISASFASNGSGETGYIFVLGVPNLSGAITASAEAGLQIVRLASVCPPTAIRPHIQEGYLLGEYPELAGYDQKQHYKFYEIDFGRRLIAKFQFDPAAFWKDKGFPRIENKALYPNRKDKLYKLTQAIRRDLVDGFSDA